MTARPRTLLLWSLGIAIAAGLIFVAVREEPVPVDLHEVAAGPMRITVDAEGKTQIRDLFEVSSPITGTTQRAPVRVGDRVIGGETVVAIVRPATPSLLDARSRVQAEAAVREAEAALHLAQTELNRTLEDERLANSNFDRTSALAERGVTTTARLEDAEQKLAAARASVEAARAGIDVANSVLERSRAALFDPATAAQADGACCVEIRAPADGLVLSIVAVSERPVLAGAPLLSIGDPRNIDLVANLLTSDAVRLAPGALAEVTRWGGERVLSAMLHHVEPAGQTRISALGIEEQRVDAVFRLLSPLDERPGLGDGYSVFLNVIEWQAEDVLQVPLSAIFRDGTGWAVFQASDGVAVRRPVEVGRRNNRMAEVLSGLEPGDRVVMHPSDQIDAGSRVIERETL